MYLCVFELNGSSALPARIPSTREGATADLKGIRRRADDSLASETGIISFYER